MAFFAQLGEANDFGGLRVEIKIASTPSSARASLSPKEVVGLPRKFGN